MLLNQLIIRGVLAVGLVAVLLVVLHNISNPQDDRRAASVQTRPTPTAAASPTPTALPRPTLNPTPLPPQDQLCAKADDSLAFADAILHDYWGQIIALVYCDGTDLRYVTYVDMDGQIERTYLFEDGVVRVKLYHADGSVAKREDFDGSGNLVPDGTHIKLPNNRIGPGL